MTWLKPQKALHFYAPNFNFFHAQSDFKPYIFQKLTNEMTMTYRLIYKSKAAHPLSDGEWRSLAMLSALKNKTLNIAGLLLHYNNHVMQVLEGPEDAVKTLFARISEDPRHTNITCMYSQTVDEPVFQDWSMGYRPVNSMEEMDMFFALSKEALDKIAANTNQSDVRSEIEAYGKEAGLN
jgi:hypothetical protein